MSDDSARGSGTPAIHRPGIIAPAMRVLHVTDPARSIAFYCDVLGFEAGVPGRDGDPGALVELVLDAARVQLVPDGADEPETREVVFFQTDDCVGMHAIILARGGDPSETARVNWIKYKVFEVRDPDGHAVWFGESLDRPDPVAPEPMLEKALPMLPCADVAAAIAHYADVLGFHINYKQDDLGVMDRDAITLLLVPGGGGVTFGAAEFYVRDADGLHAELVARGAAVQGEPVSHPWGLRDFQVLDLDGNRLTFAQPFE